MKLIITLSLLFFASIAFGQITLTKADLPVVGDSVKTKTAVLKTRELPLAAFDTAKSEFDLDLSKLSIVERGMEVFDDPSNLTGGADVPQAEFGYSTPEGVLFFKNSKNSLEMVGVGLQQGPLALGFPLDSSIEFLHAPLSFPYNHVDSAFGSKKIPIPPITANVAINSTYEVNGYGKLKIPGDSTYEVLRIKRELAFEVKVVPAVFGPVYTTLVTWEFYANDIKSTILRVLVDTVADAGGNITDTNFLFTFYDDGRMPVGKEVIAKNEIDIIAYGQNVRVNSVEELNNLEVYSLDGRKVFENQNLMAGQTFSLPKMQSGVYLLKVTTASGQVKVKKVLF